MSSHLTEKWEPILGHQDLPEISDSYKKAVTAQLLENQERYMREQSAMGSSQGLLNEADYAGQLQGGPPTVNLNPAGSGYPDGMQQPVTAIAGDGAPGFSSYADGRGPVAGFDPVMISLIRRSMPNLIAYDICGVQPMTGPTGLIFAMRSMYDGQLGPKEAFFDEPDVTHSNRYGLPGTQTPNADPTTNGVGGTVPYANHPGDPLHGLDANNNRISANPGLLENARPPISGADVVNDRSYVGADGKLDPDQNS